MTESTPIRRLLLFHGLKRSGNHAVINWLRGQAPISFANNIIPTRPIRWGQAAMPGPRPFRRWLERARLRKTLKWEPAGDQLLVSLEDLEPGLMPFAEVECSFLHVLLVRSAENVFASRLHRISLGDRFRGDCDPEFVDLWAAYAREHLGDTNCVPSKICISYDRWFTDRAYREAISSALDLPFSDRNIAHIPPDGGGSSFDRRRFQRRATEMNVLDRAADLSPDERHALDGILDRGEVRELSARLRADTRPPDALRTGIGGATTRRPWSTPRVERKS